VEIITLTRSGQPPLRFRGELLAESDGQRQANREHNRYHTVRIWRTVAGRYLLCIAYHTHFQGELDWQDAVALDTPGAVTDMLVGHEPCANLRGYPPGPDFAERQARLETDIRSRWEAQVSDLLASSPEFAEEVP
jgi:hypothetical protein